MLSIVSGDAQASVLTRGVRVSSRWLLLSVGEADGTGELVIDAFDPLYANSYAMSLFAEDWAFLGIGELASLTDSEKEVLSHRLCDLVRLADDRLVLELPPPVEPAAVVEAEPELASDAEVAELVVRGTRVDGKLLLIWVFVHGSDSLMVNGFDPISSEKIGELRVGPDDWAATGYGSLSSLSSTEIENLCKDICRMLKLDAEGKTFTLNASVVEAAMGEEAVAPAVDGEVLLSRGIELSGRKYFVTVFEENGAIGVNGLDAVSLAQVKGEFMIPGMASMSPEQKQIVAQELCFKLVVAEDRFLAEEVAADSGNGTELINVRGHAVPCAGTGAGRPARRFLVLTYVDWSARGFLEVQCFDPRAATMQTSSVSLPADSNFNLLGPTGKRLVCEKISRRASVDSDGQLSFE
jgi:hypothetical protein